MTRARDLANRIVRDGSVDTAQLVADAVDNTILDLTDDYAFTGTIDGAGESWTKTAQTTTSGASTYTISGLPSDVSEIVVIGNNVDRGTSSSRAVIRLGDSGGLETTGYSYSPVYTANANSLYQNSMGDKTGLEFALYGDPTNFVCRCWNTSGNKWMMMLHSHSSSNGGYWVNSGCEKELSATLDRVGVVDLSGTNFAGGSFQLWYK